MNNERSLDDFGVLHDLGPPQHAFLDFCWPVLLHQEGKSMYQAAGRIAHDGH